MGRMNTATGQLRATARPAKGKEGEAMTRRTMALLSVLALAAMPASAWAAGMLRYAGRFYAGGSELDIARYSDGKTKVGIVGINRSRDRTSVAFAASDWHSFVALWEKARRAPSATWQTIGAFKETGTDDARSLSVAAGSGVQFTITGKQGSFAFVLSPRDYGAFDTTVKRMTIWFAH